VYEIQNPTHAFFLIYLEVFFHTVDFFQLNFTKLVVIAAQRERITK